MQASFIQRVGIAGIVAMYFKSEHAKFVSPKLSLKNGLRERKKKPFLVPTAKTWLANLFKGERGGGDVFCFCRNCLRSFFFRSTFETAKRNKAESHLKKVKSKCKKGNKFICKLHMIFKRKY